jgi:hypothetical protein
VEFKKGWEQSPSRPSEWQAYLRRGKTGCMQKENTRYQKLIRVWQHLLSNVTRMVPPMIVRGIPWSVASRCFVNTLEPKMRVGEMQDSLMKLTPSLGEEQSIEDVET